jgi:hypothetical protein
MQTRSQTPENSTDERILYFRDYHMIKTIKKMTNLKLSY